MKEKLLKKKERKKLKREINPISSDNFNPDKTNIENEDFYKKAYKGLIPWSPDEWGKAIKWEMKRSTGSKGDWGMVIKLNWINIYFNKTYSPEVSLAHSVRYLWIMLFLLHQYKSKLIDEGLIIVTEDNNLFNPALLEALCVLPYSEEENDEEGELVYKFSYQEVVNKARSIMNQSGDSVEIAESTLEDSIPTDEDSTLTVEDWVEIFEHLPSWVMEAAHEFTPTEIKMALFMIWKQVNCITKKFSINDIAKKIGVSPRDVKSAKASLLEKWAKVTTNQTINN